MTTTSSEVYKGYIIQLRAKTLNGFWYSIIKQVSNEKSPNGIKNIYLREQGFNFITPAELKLKAKNYIDNFSNKLEEKFERLSENYK